MNYITRNAFDRLNGGKVEAGDILYCLRGSTIGKTARNHFAEGAIASSLVIIRANRRAYQDFLYFFLTSPTGQVLARSTTTALAQPNLSVRALANYKLLLPPLPEQKAIAAVLGALDDKIELNRRMNETLETMARALFQSWFVDFDPVRAKSEGRRPEGMDDETARLFPGRGLRNQNLGMIPSGWTPGDVGQIAVVVDCLHTKKPERHIEGKVYLQLNNIRDDGLLDLSDTFLISDEDYENWTSRFKSSGRRLRQYQCWPCRSRCPNPPMDLKQL